MLIKIISTTLLMIVTNVAIAQSTAYTVSSDPKNGKVVFKGPVTYEDLNKEPTFSWLKNGADKYSPRHKKTHFLKSHLTATNYSFVVFLGTWCGDTHELLPKFFKVLNDAGYPLTGVTMYGVERDKTNRGEEVKKYNITNLPTIILLKDGKETGRITESVKKRVETDLAAMID